jgi:pimeloyl-ACP methyl ester carboxylesterase
VFTHGRFDGIIPVEAAQYGHSITPGSSLSIFEHLGHSPFMEEPDRFNDEVRDFVLRCHQVEE